MAARRKELRLIGGYARGKGLQTLGVVLLAGLIGMSLGTFTFLTAVQRSGAARTSILTSAMPLFGVPFSLVLGEKLTARTVMGTFAFGSVGQVGVSTVPVHGKNAGGEHLWTNMLV